jgi:hypothetical protein
LDAGEQSVIPVTISGYFRQWSAAVDTNLIIAVSGTLIAVIGLFFSGINYRAGEKWKRTEFARQLIDRLSTDDELAFCTRALDWGVGPLVIPAKHRVLFPEGTARMDHDLEVLERAIHPDLQRGWRTPAALTYRYSFDAFFSYLHTVIHYVTEGLIARKQLVGLDYYLDLVANPLYLRPSPAPSEQAAGEAPESAYRPFIKKFYPDLLPFIWPPKQLAVSRRPRQQRPRRRLRALSLKLSEK